MFYRSSWERGGGGDHFSEPKLMKKFTSRLWGKKFNKNHLEMEIFLINFNCHPLKACIFVKFNNHKKTTASIIYLFLNWIICTLKEKRASERQWTAFFFVVVASDFLLMFLSCERKNLPKSYQLFFSLFLSSRLVICQIFKYILKDFLFCVCSRVYSYKFF